MPRSLGGVSIAGPELGACEFAKELTFGGEGCGGHLGGCGECAGNGEFVLGDSKGGVVETGCRDDVGRRVCSSSRVTERRCGRRLAWQGCGRHWKLLRSCELQAAGGPILYHGNNSWNISVNIITAPRRIIPSQPTLECGVEMVLDFELVVCG